MALNVTIFDTHAEIKVNAKTIRGFQMDLAQIHATFEPKDCVFDGNRKVWVLSNFKKYAGVPMVARAMESRQLQGELFK